MTDKILRLPEVKSRLGLSRSSIYLAIRNRVLPRPISLGGRSVGFVEREVAAVLAARIRGEGDDEIRGLVSQLEADRAKAVA